MGDETSKSIGRRLLDPAFRDRYFVGHGIDIGAGSDCLDRHHSKIPKMLTVKNWDQADGDARYMTGVSDNSYDFVHSSHCLEHVTDPYEAVRHWFRIVKPGGYLVVIVPDEDMYEQGRWPPHFNGDHKYTFTTWKRRSWSPKSVNTFDLITQLGEQAEPIKVESLHYTYDWSVTMPIDQTGGPAESAIEFIVRKRTIQELQERGRTPSAR